MATTPPGPRDLVRWSEALAAIARTGLAFTPSAYERERYEEILLVAGDIAAAADEAIEGTGPSAESYVDEWLREIPSGTEGYRTPRVSVGAIVGNDAGELLLVKRPDSGRWLYPTGWADVGYSAAEIAVKEVAEETGILVEPLRLAMVLDGLRLGASRTPMYSLVFHCRPTGGDLVAHPLECEAVGWFAQEALPGPLAGQVDWVDHVFATLRGQTTEVRFDRPRAAAWRRKKAGGSGGPQPERPSRR